MSQSNIAVWSFPDSRQPAQRLAGQLDVRCSDVEVHVFPDEESLVTLPTAVSAHLIFYRSLDRPNHKLIELMFAAKSARERGCKRITLVSPYLCYMRQDKENHPGEVVSQKHLGRFLADLFDDVITVDPHLHRIERLEQAIPLENAVALSAMHELARYVSSQLRGGILLGPDAESAQWVAQVAEDIGFDFGVATKTRLGDRSVRINLPETDFSRKHVVIIDDVASTGRTVAEAARLLYERNVADVSLAITHALFTGEAEETIRNAGVKQIWSTDSITHSSNVVALANLIAGSLKKII